jgi:hypothetical protein
VAAETRRLEGPAIRRLLVDESVSSGSYKIVQMGLLGGMQDVLVDGWLCQSLHHERFGSQRRKLKEAREPFYPLNAS